MDRLEPLLAAIFSQYAHDLGPARPDGGRVLSLSTSEGEVVLRRVLSGEQLADERSSQEALEAISRDLAVQEGRICNDVIHALRQRAAQVLSYDT
ncbi:Protein of unknown function [Pseudomonas citronellolis]|uniref:DUF3509 domain-containing protein n=1 Tax=Pseudomonas citronellolis TaxID=53408 RepID=A0AAQ1HKS9_9PSED|nr:MULTISPECIES: DUF3509 domain-containing protein [Pseudomonas]MCL6688798.1 DUF3509 domain-containing protein [Pseudomonas sp. R3.Fl]MCP1641742.1 hypothetical protein [Pseudomonas citronellolis]MCP1664660.1 hypothetical protein [Pseudomonas citronellolis]MCP1695881.1 hypothetical protein [Pseudomonas citronellolis]MCP1702496.1 hypothetical protein [Pseudomonas citronellolis]